MKCPECKFVSSDLRDICPKCFVDLRPHKRELGLPITNAAASYESLRQKIAGSKRATSPSASATENSSDSIKMGVFFKRFLEKEDPNPAEFASRISGIPTIERPPEFVENLHGPGSLKTGPFIPEQGPPKLEVGRAGAPTAEEQAFAQADAEINEILDSFGPVTNKFSPSSDSSESTFEIDFDDGTTPVIEATVSIETTAPKATSPNQISESAAPLSDPPLVLFRRAREELDRLFGEQELSFSGEQFVQTKGREDIAVLFALSRDALLDPQAESRYQNTVVTSVARELDTASLKEQLKVVEANVNRPMVSLKGTGAPQARTSSPNARIGAEAASSDALESPSAILRTAAWLVDSFVLAVIGGIFALMLLLATNPDAVFNLSENSNLSLVQIVQLAGFGGVAWLLGGILYELIALGMFGTTPGLSVTGQEIYARNGRVVSRLQALIRATSRPLSFILFGYLPLLFGRETLHDWLAATKVGRPIEDLPQDG